MVLKCIFSLIIFSLVSCSMENSLSPSFKKNITVSPKVIYGLDDRRDWHEEGNLSLLSLAESTAGLFDAADINLDFDGSLSVSTQKYNLCEDEPFSGQETGPWCSSFLIAPDLIATAGHCIADENDCSNIAVVFGFAHKTPSDDPSSVKESDVYNCVSVVAKKESLFSSDWAIIKLDRPVTGREPLAIRRSGTIELNTPLFSISHPSGLPSKITDSGSVLELERRYFKTDLDLFATGSGGAVFNAETLEVEGIISRGRADYIFDEEKQCLVSNVCDQELDANCALNLSRDTDAEHITKITEAVSFIPELIESSPIEIDEKIIVDEPNYYSNKETHDIRDNISKTTVSIIKDIPEVLRLKEIKVNIEHSYISDLTVKLIAPNGESIFLHKRTGDDTKNLSGVYGKTLTSFDDLGSISPQENGDWTLQIKDHAPYDEGVLIEWGIIL